MEDIIELVQEQVNNLVERRLSKLGELSILEVQKKDIVEDIKEVQTEFDGIDSLFKERLEKLKELKGGVESGSL